MEKNGEIANGYIKQPSSSSHGNNEGTAIPLSNAIPSVRNSTFQRVHPDDSVREVGSSEFCQVGVVHRIPCSEVPLLFREAHVQAGFRPLHRPWWYYPLTTLHLHNESMNIWTHALGVVLLLVKFIRFSFQLDFLNDPYTWPLLAGFFCGMSLFTASAGAHCMQSKSELFHYTVFMIDYAGIGLYGLGSVIVHLEYCSEDSFYNAVAPWFVPAGCVLAIAICFCCSVAKVIYVRPYPFRRKFWQILPVLSIYVLLISPIVHHVITYYASSAAEYSPGISYHNLQMTWFFLSGLFFASDVPQRFFPGKCDYFFHSHQLFHIAIMLCILYQMEGVFIDFLSRRPLVEMRPKPTLTSSFGPVVITIVAEAITIVGFWIYITRHLVEKKPQQESQKNK